MSRLTKKIEELEKENQEIYIDLGAYQNENENLVKDIEKYWELEKELGCPLEVVIKALKEGIITNPKYNDETELMTLEYDDGLNKYGFVNLLDKYPISYYLKDYKKTWWLKGEKDEGNRV